MTNTVGEITNAPTQCPSPAMESIIENHDQ